jgi:TorA maturation chaperone TorD
LGSPQESLSDSRFLEDLFKAFETTDIEGFKENVSAVKEELSREGVAADILNSEYTYLFHRGACPPYETSYNPERSFSKTNDLADIAGFYRAFGIKHKNEAPDHIVSELEFMGLLCLKEALAVANSMQKEAEICSEARRKFLSEHLGNWVSHYSMRMRKEARLGVYPAIADLVRSFVTLDAASAQQVGNGP